MDRLISLNKLQEFPVRINHYDEKNGNVNFVLGIETVIEYAENLSIAFDISKVLEQLEEYGKYKGVLYCEDENFKDYENYIPVSVAKRIVRYRGLSGVLGYLEEKNENMNYVYEVEKDEGQRIINSPGIDKKFRDSCKAVSNKYCKKPSKVMKLSTIHRKIGKQPLYITKHTDAKVFIAGISGEYYITGIRYENGKLLGFNAVPIDCSTCKNNVEFPSPHTCDICTSLDQEEEYGMWEAK